MSSLHEYALKQQIKQAKESLFALQNDIKDTLQSIEGTVRISDHIYERLRESLTDNMESVSPPEVASVHVRCSDTDTFFTLSNLDKGQMSHHLGERLVKPGSEGKVKVISACLNTRDGSHFELVANYNMTSDTQSKMGQIVLDYALDDMDITVLPLDSLD